MLRTPVPPHLPDDEAARAVLRGNLRVALASFLAGILSCAIALPVLEISASARGTALATLGGLLVLGGGILLFGITRPPQWLVRSLQQRLESSRNEPGGPPLETWTNLGAACVGGLAFVWAACIVFVLAA